MRPRGTFALSFLLLVLLLPASLAAISVFDVIRLSQERYSDEDIIRLIQTTDSRFVLSADDTVRLRTAGVTESVIREMLARPAPRGESEPPASGAGATPLRSPATARSSRGALFTASAHGEKTGSHPAHAAVTLGGMEVLIVRDGASFPSPLARARAITQTLNGLAAQAPGRFAARAAGRDAKVVFERSDGAATDVVAVTAADVAAWRVPGGRPLSAGTLASFWAGLLNDYWLIGVGKP